MAEAALNRLCLLCCSRVHCAARLERGAAEVQTGSWLRVIFAGALQPQQCVTSLSGFS